MTTASAATAAATGAGAVTATTSTFAWDTGRAITNAVAVILLGRAVLAALRRAGRRPAFDAPVTFTQ